MVWDDFSLHCLESLVLVPISLNTIRCIELPGDHLLSFMLCGYPRGNGVFSKTTAHLTSHGWLLAWQVVPVERFQKLVESMIRRMAAIIKVRGGPTRY
ncbi:transposable element Tcb2 transposase [Trichonephila clavipes]|nr:transposable element Tcb2 transposase [Trichonephila clavipes]